MANRDVSSVVPPLSGLLNVRGRPVSLVQATTALLFIVLFWQPLVTLGRDWWSDPDAGHGLLLFPVALYLAWKSGLVSPRKPQPILGTLVLAAAVLSVGVLAGGLRAADEKADPKVGDKAPTFQATDDQGKPWKSSDHVGKKVVVVYFYPADFTGGCTKQACGYRDDFSKLQDAGVEVVGISGDSVKNHAAFKKFHKLNFTLLADPKGEAAAKLGVPFTPGEKTVQFEIDGQQVTVPAGTSLMRAAIESGISVPKLCATDSLEPFGSCRLCLVEIEGRRGYPASCTTPAEAAAVSRRPSSAFDTLKSCSVVILMLVDSPSTSRTECPASSASDASSVAAVSTSRPCSMASSSTARLNACGVCAR